MNVLDLFSGIGGFSLGLERAGMKTVAFCEIEPFCRRVLNRHWPEVPIYDDVTTLTARRLRDDGVTVNLVCGGFPCQDISVAGRGDGLDGARSGLWREFYRLIDEIKPRWVVIENVAALRTRGLDVILSSLDAIGYVGEWHLIPASACGAPHRRERIWIVATYAGRPARRRIIEERRRRSAKIDTQRNGDGPPDGGQIMAHTDSRGRRVQGYVGGAIGDSIARQLSNRRARRWWETEPDVGRVVDGPADEVDRRKRLIALGNSLVPQIPEMIGRAIMEIER